MAPRLQIPSSARRSGTSVTRFLTCHVVWHPLYFAPHLPPRSPHHPPTPPQAGPTDPMPPLRQSPVTLPPNQLSPPTPVRMPMSFMVAPGNSIRLLLRMLLPVWAMVVFVTGRGGAGFHPRGPAATRARGAFFRVIPAPSPVRGDSPLIPWTEPRFSPPKITGARLGNGRGRRRG